MLKLTEPLPGQTPLDPDCQKDLIPMHIVLMSELNEFELENIAQATKKYLLGRRKNWKVEDPETLKQIHRSMFNQTWKWAGQYRRLDTNIGSDWRQIRIHVKDACEDLGFWIKNRTFPSHEIAIRFHHRLIWIHPFTNGNGRHGRLVADLLMRRFGLKPLSWSGADLSAAGKNRADYLSAMRKADRGDFEDLIRFAKN